MVELSELKELLKLATDVNDAIIESNKKISELACRLHDLIEREEEDDR